MLPTDLSGNALKIRYAYTIANQLTMGSFREGQKRGRKLAGGPQT